jgi:type I restriction enzyme, S subunit
VTVARWSTVTVGDVLARPLRNGISPSSNGTVLGEVLTLAAVTGGRFDANARKAAKFVSDHAPEKTVRRDDLLICRGNGNIGLVGQARRAWVDMPDVAFPDTMIGASFDAARVDLGYVEYLWGSRIVRGQIEKMARSTNGTLKINQGMVEGIEIPLPPIEEQRRIASLLDAADSLRAKRRESLAKLDTLTQAIFINMFGDPAAGGTPLVPLVEAVSAPITRGIDQPGPDVEDGVPYLKTTDFRGPSPQRATLARSSPDIAAKFPRSVVATGDTVICIRATVGPTMYITDELDHVNLSRGTARVSPSGEVLPKFLFTALNSVHFQRQIREKLRGATFLQIPLKELKQLRVPLPSMADQQRFVEAVKAVEVQVASLQSSRASLDSLFSSLQQRAFRGEL